MKKTKLKIGDVIGFNFLGELRKGKVVDLSEDGGIRIKTIMAGKETILYLYYDNYEVLEK